MAAASRRFAYKTFLSPGQRFRSMDVLSPELTVARLVRDKLGLLHVTLRAEDGREISAFVEQVEVAIEEGHLTPVFPAPGPGPAAHISAC